MRRAKNNVISIKFHDDLEISEDTTESGYFDENGHEYGRDKDRRERSRREMHLLRYQDDRAVTTDKRDHLRKWLLHHEIRRTVSVYLDERFYLFSLFYLSITRRTRIRSDEMPACIRK